MAVLAPASEVEAAKLVADAAAQRRTLGVEGKGSKRGLGRLIETSDVLTLSALRGVVAYEPEELVITVRAGTSLSEVERVLAEKNQCLAFEPGSWSRDASREATIGGALAAGACGSRRVVLGGARDHLIGFRAINGQGEVFKAGGRVVKNVTGYDLPKLAAGSFGTLFAMTELTLRTYPRTAVPTSLLVRDLDVESGCALMRKAASTPFEATGFCYLPRTALARMDLGVDAASLTVFRFEGGEESMAVRAEAFSRLLAPQGTTQVDARIWTELRDLAPFRNARTVWRLCVPPAAAVAAIAALRPECFVADWAGGLLWAEPRVATTPVEVHRLAREFGGHAMLFRGDGEARRGAVFPPLDAATMALTRRLKEAFDPGRVFNPGRMHDGI
jgi:glycolate oxidase FAD binding subunit